MIIAAAKNLPRYFFYRGIILKGVFLPRYIFCYGIILKRRFLFFSHACAHDLYILFLIRVYKAKLYTIYKAKL